MGQNTQQFGTRENQLRGVNQILHESSVETQLSQITNILNKLVTRGVQTAVTYNICYLDGRVFNAILICKGGMLMLCFLMRAKEDMTPITIPIIRDGRIMLA